MSIIDCALPKNDRLLSSACSRDGLSSLRLKPSRLTTPPSIGPTSIRLGRSSRRLGFPPTLVAAGFFETGLSSATAKVGDPVEAVITEPLVASNHLILPEGSLIKGSVMQVSPARRLGRNRQLRIRFREAAPPNGIGQKVETNLEGVAVAKGEHLKLDNEGGAEVTTPRTRYLTTGIQVMLAASQASPDRDARQGGQSVGEAGNGGANGASGFKLVGMVVALAANSRASAEANLFPELIVPSWTRM
jgi:hypothetical protein